MHAHINQSSHDICVLICAQIQRETKTTSGKSRASTYIDVYYGRVIGIFKERLSRKGMPKLQSQVRMHIEDDDAVFLCKWYDPVMVAAPDQQPSTSKPRGNKPTCRRVDGRRAFKYPISCEEGYNWHVKVRDGRVLCPVQMTWDEDAGAFLLDKESEEEAKDTALAATAKAGHKHIGEKELRAEAQPATSRRAAPSHDPCEQAEQVEIKAKKQKARADRRVARDAKQA